MSAARVLGLPASSQLPVTVGKVERLYAAALGDYKQGRYLEAAKIFLGLLLMDSTQARFFKGAAACMQMQGQYKQAATNYLSAFMLNEEDPEPLLYLAQCLLGAGAPSEAREVADEFLILTAALDDYAALRSRAVAVLNSAEGQCASQKKKENQ